MNTNPVDFLLFSKCGGQHSAISKMSPLNNIPEDSIDRTYMGFRPWRALGPSKIANSLRSNGYTVQIINFVNVLSEEELYDISKLYMDTNTIIGISTTFFEDMKDINPEHIPFCRVIDRLKLDYGSKIILGGPIPDRFTTLFNADHIIRGWAENAILDLVDKIKNHGIRRTRQKEWTIQTCSHRWHESDRIQPGETLPIEISRGCIYSCNFCRYDMKGKKQGEYVRDFSLLRDEIIENYERYQVTNYMIMDDTFNDDPVKMEDWCKMVDGLPFTIQYTAHIRTDLLHRYQEIARELYKQGMIGAILGIETFNTAAAKSINKQWSSKYGKEFVPYYVHDICGGKTLTSINFIIGLPGDTIQDGWDWIKWSEENKIPNVSFQTLSVRIPKYFPNEAVYSDFELYADEKYGYTFPNPDNRNHWINGDMSYIESLKASSMMLKYVNEHFTEQSWAGLASMGLGYTLDELISTTVGQRYQDPRLLQQQVKWVDNYVRDISLK
jgi:hypothetical protein